MDAEKHVDGLVRSGSNVRELQLEYSAIDDRMLMRLLPKLQNLKRLEILNLSRNRLTSLPSNLGRYLPNVTSLDIASNFFSGVSKAIDALSSLPKLTDLSADITAKDEKIVFERLPKLKRLNGVDLTSDGTSKNSAGDIRKRQEVTLTEKDLREVSILYGKIRKLSGNRSEALTAKFDKHMQGTMEHLAEKLDAVKYPRMKDPYLRQGEMLLAKFKLHELCFEELCNVAESSDTRFAEALRTMKDAHAKLFSEFPAIIYDMRPHYKRRIAEMQDEVVRSERETAQLLQAAEMLEKEAEAHAEQKELMAEKFDKERNRLLLENRRLRDANEKLKSRRGVARKTATPSSSKKKTPGRRTGRGESKRASPSGESTKIGGVVVRDLSLKQLKDHIAAIYASKLAFDAKCKDAHLPRETMEQHMYTYLNQKYGLRKLIVEHAASIVKAMHRFSEKDNDVDVFRNIYENRIDEEFRFVQQRLKDTVSELLRVYLKGKFPRKTDDAINNLLRQKTKGFVIEEEWADIVKYMYNREDSVNLVALIKNTISSQPVPAAPAIGRGHSRKKAQKLRREDPIKKGKIMFSHFLHHLLSFQLVGHRSFLSKFHQTFTIYDVDKNGVLDEEQMRMLIRDVDTSKSDSDIDAIIQEVDPYNNQNITYSECVNALSSELVSSVDNSNESGA